MAKFVKGRAQTSDRKRFIKTNNNMAKFPGFARFSPFLEALNVLDNTPCANNEFLAVRGGETCSGRSTVKQRDTKFVLDFLDPFADDRLPDIEFIRGGAELPFLALTTM